MAMLNGRMVNTIAGAAPSGDDEWEDVSSDEWEDVPTHKDTKKGKNQGTWDQIKELARAGTLGFSQGGTFGFADEIASKLADLARRDDRIRPGAAAPPELRAALEGQPTLGERLKGKMRAENKAASDEHPWAYGAGEVAGNVAATYAGGKALSAAGEAVPVIGKGLQALGTWARANPIKALALAGGAQGGVNGAGASEAKDAEGVALDTILGTALGAGTGVLTGVAGKVAGKGLEKLRGRAQKGVEVATEEIAELGKKTAAEQTASARSAAGRAAQDAYRQLEHLRDLDALGALSPEQKVVAEQLAEELAAKAQEKLLPAAAEKAATSAAYQEAMATEAQRAAAAAKDHGSVWNQLKPRIKRYALPLVAGAVGLPSGGVVGMGAGALAGRGLSPTAQALTRMVKHPATRRAIWDLLGGGARAAEAVAPVTSALRGPVSRAFQMEMDDPLIQALAEFRGEEEADPRALAQALGSGR